MCQEILIQNIEMLDMLPSVRLALTNAGFANLNEVVSKRRRAMKDALGISNFRTLERWLSLNNLRLQWDPPNPFRHG